MAMLLKMAICTVWHEKEKLSGAVLGVALGIFLVVFQWGLYYAYKRDTTIVLDAMNADIWIVPKNQSSFDDAASMDDLSYRRAKKAAGIQDVARVIWGDAGWRNPISGGQDYVQILGIDPESSIAMRFVVSLGGSKGESLASPPPSSRLTKLGARIGTVSTSNESEPSREMPAYTGQYATSSELAQLVRPDGHVLVGSMDRKKLGLADRPDGPLEISGRQAMLAGYVDDVRLFSTAGFVLTDIDNARAFLGLPSSSVTYIVCRCRADADVPAVVRQLQAAIPEHDVLTTRQFHDLCSNYWETVSGIGPLIFLSSILGVTVGFLIVITTFYISTIEKIPMYGCVKALGGTMWEIAAVLGIQVVVVFLLGAAVAGAALAATLAGVRYSMISLLVTPNLVAAGLGTMFGCSILGALISIRRLFVIDPGEAFRT